MRFQSSVFSIASAGAISTLFLASGTSAEGRQSASFATPATQTAIIMQDGPKSGASAERYFNVEGKAKSKYASFGIVRFDVGPLKASLDKKYGVGKYQITGVTLHLTQSLASFSAPGGVNIYFSPDDSTAVTSLRYPYNPAGAALKGSLAAIYRFAIPNRPATAKGGAAAHAPTVDTVDVCNLTKPAGLKPLAQHIMLGKSVTLVLAEADPNVAATWVGKNNNRATPPALFVTVSAKSKAVGKVH